MGLRLFELDVHDDPEGGRFSNPGFLRLIEQAPLRLPFGAGAMDELKQPGFKVLHHAEWDFRSTNYLLTGCLREIDTWSDAHPGICRSSSRSRQKSPTRPRPSRDHAHPPQKPFDADTWQRLEATIRATVPAVKLFYARSPPRDHATLKEALAAKGWPTLEQLKGKFLFLLLNKKEPSLSYLKLDPLLRGRVFSSASHPIIPRPRGSGCPIRPMKVCPA